MKQWGMIVLALTLCYGSTVYSRASDSPGKSEWVYYNDQGKLEYKTTEDGDKITDFSYAGYMGGGVALPDLPVRKTVSPLADGADCVQLIQAAINEVGAMTPDENGFRGAVLLEPGDYPCATTINIPVSGVVLRGTVDADGELKSAIRMTGTRKYAAIRVQRGGREPGGGGQRSAEAAPAAQTTLADVHVPSGAISFRVKDATGFQVGDRIEIRRPVTAAWIEFVEMHNLVRGGNKQTWISEGSRINVERKITAIDGDLITVDVALTDSYNPKYLNPPGTIIAKLLGPSQLIN